MGRKELVYESDIDLSFFARSDDPTGVITRGHKFLQRVMRHLIYVAIPRPDNRIYTLKYDALLQLCNSLGVVTDAEYQFLSYINSIRDKAGHDDFELAIAHEQRAVILWTQTTRSLILTKKFGEQNVAANFPQALALTIVAFYYALLKRAVTIQNESKRLPSLVDSVRDNNPYATIMSASVLHSAARTGADPEQLGQKYIEMVLNNFPEYLASSGEISEMPTETASPQDGSTSSESVEPTQSDLGTPS